MKRTREHQKFDIRLFGFIALGVFSLGTFLSIGGLGRSISDLRSSEISKSPTALLASSGLKDQKNISMPVTYWDQLADPCGDLEATSGPTFLTTREFEWTSCDYTKKNLEQGLVESQLGLGNLPVPIKGRLTPNTGINFTGWFEEIPDKSREIAGTLLLRYSADEGTFTFEADDFYPLDDISFSADDPTSSDDHNHLFTMSFMVPFTVVGSGTEMFTVRADDDTFVFLNGELVVDLGGVHGPMTGAFNIDSDGQVYTSVNGADWSRTGVSVEPDTIATVQVFHADRDSSESDFSIQFSDMNLAIDRGTQIAAIDPSNPLDPTFTAPLGETKIFQPDTTRSLALIATIEGAAILVMSVMTAAVARYLLRRQ